MTTVDLDAIREEYLKQCGPHDFGLVEYGCNCPSGEPRWAIQRLADEVERLRQELDEARAERDRMRPVVEAADAYMNEYGWLLHADRDNLAAIPSLADGERFKLLAAVEAFRSATPDAEPAPGVPVDTEEGTNR